MIIRGTTPTIAFHVNGNFDMTQIAEVWITFKPKYATTSEEKTFDIDDVTIDTEKREISLSLTQEDTLAFSSLDTLVQLRIRTNNDEAYATDIFETKIGRILKEGVI